MKALTPRTQILILLLLTGFLAGCEKKEQPLVLPPQGKAVPGNVEMGPEYEDQVFYDLSANRVVKTSKVVSWDLAFEADPDGRHVFVNGGKNIYVYNTRATQFITNFTGLPSTLARSTWEFDAPCGLPDSTAIGEWLENGTSKNEVYIVQINDTVYKKIRLILVNSQHYIMQYGNLGDTAPKTIELRKDPIYNYIYFNFDKGVVMPEPPKHEWDLVFTRYRHVYRDLNNFTYLVNGPLLNPYRTSAAADSSRTFEDINLTTSAGLQYSKFRDVIGFDWKNYNFNTGRYEVRRHKNYVLHTRNKQVFKLRFLDFYNQSGVKGSPSFEYERLQ